MKVEGFGRCSNGGGKSKLFQSMYQKTCVFFYFKLPHFLFLFCFCLFSLFVHKVVGWVVGGMGMGTLGWVGHEDESDVLTQNAGLTFCVYT